MKALRDTYEKVPLHLKWIRVTDPARITLYQKASKKAADKEAAKSRTGSIAAGFMILFRGRGFF